MNEIKTFRIESSRLKDWDYSHPGYYFVTFNTFKFIKYFGVQSSGIIKLNQLGSFAYDNWKEIPKHYHHISIDEFIIMPNHIHGIIIINSRDGTCPVLKEKSDFVKDATSGVSTDNVTLGNIVGSFKAGVSKYAHELGIAEFKWQTRFYDRIIRNDIELNKIRKYIKYNHLK